MKFDRNKNPAACVSKEATRYSTNGVGVIAIGERKFLAATDGHKLSLIACEPEEGDDVSHSAVVSYPAEAFAAVRKNAKRSGAASLRLNGAAHVLSIDGSEAKYPAIEARFPDVAGVVPTGACSLKFHVNAKSLAELQTALGADGVTIELRFGLPDKNGHLSGPLKVEPIYMHGGTADGSFGVLMPLTTK